MNMIKRGLLMGGVMFLAITLSSCIENTATNSSSTPLNMSNPASDYCLEQGYFMEIVSAEDGSQSGICRFPDGTSCDEWAYFQGECGPESQAFLPEDTQQSESNTNSAEIIYTPVPTFSFADYLGWWTYQHPGYGFSLMLPEDWTVHEETSSTNMLSGHLITLYPDPALSSSIWITFRQTGEEILLWPTGVGEGEFIQQGTLEIPGVSIQRSHLVCPTGEITSIWYQGTEGDPAIKQGDLEFGIIYRASDSHCEPGISIEGKNQMIGEMIIASLSTP